MGSYYCTTCGRMHYSQAAPVVMSGLTWGEIVGLFAQIIAAIVVGSVALGFLWGWLV